MVWLEALSLTQRICGEAGWSRKRLMSVTLTALWLLLVLEPEEVQCGARKQEKGQGVNGRSRAASVRCNRSGNLGSCVRNVVDDLINQGGVFPLQVSSGGFVVIRNTQAVFFLSSQLDNRSCWHCAVLLPTFPSRGLLCWHIQSHSRGRFMDVLKKSEAKECSLTHFLIPP